MRPASNPDYYDNLVKELDEAPNRSRFQSWVNKWKGFLRFSWGNALGILHLEGVAAALSPLDRNYSLGGYALEWCYGALSRRASYYIELLPPSTILRLVYIFHEMNASIPGYKVSLKSVGMQSLLISEACFIYPHERISVSIAPIPSRNY